MSDACVLAARMATGDVFSDEEISSLLDRLTDKARRAGKADPTLDERAAISKAAGELTREELMASLTAKRLELASKVATQARRARLDGMPDTMSPAQKLDSYNVGSERQGLGTSSSVDAEGRARQMTLWGQVQIGIEKVPGLFDRIANPLGFAEKGIERKVAREMARLNGDGSIEPTGDEGALHIAQVFVKALDDVRLQQNDQGAWINKLPGYIARQSHDAGKIAAGLWSDLAELGRQAKEGGFKLDWAKAREAAEARSFREWADFIMPRLDPKTFDGLTLEDVPFQTYLTDEEADAAQQRGVNRQKDLAAAQALAARGVLRDPTDLRELMLHTVWLDVVTGRHSEISGASDNADFRPPASKARAVSKARVLHFKDPDAFIDYSARYGRGGLFNTVMMQLERGAKNAALMERWGPSPEAAWTAEKSRMVDEARAKGDTRSIRQLDGNMVQANFEAINGRGETPANMRLAQTMRTIRSYEALTKLGGIVLSKATDLPISGHTFARAGAGFLEGYRGFFTGVLNLGSADAKRAADALDVGARSFAGHMGGQYLASDGAAGWTSWATRLLYKINLFSAFNEAVRNGGAQVYSRFLGQEAEHAWDALQQGTRETFERFGIGPGDWDAVRRGLTAATDGRKYFTMDHLERAAKEGGSPRASAELRLKFQALIHNILDDTVSEPRAREKVSMTRGTRAGTIWGEINRSFFQFKGFIATIVGRHMIPATRGYAGYKPAALMAHFIIGTALAGYVSMNLKLIAAGRMPRSPIGPDGKPDLAVWGAAMAQGGGFGLYGDFIFGEHDRMGGDFGWGELGGPVIADSEQVAKIVMQSIHGGDVNKRTGRTPIPAELLRVASHNIPLVNVFYTRLALDYLVLWRLQEAASPGYLRRYQNRVRDQEHGDFILSPTSAQ